MDVQICSVGETDRRKAHKAKMDQVAEHITRDPHPCLGDILFDFSFEVQSAYSIDQIGPTQVELWDFLANSGARAIELSELLRMPPLVGFLTTNSDATSDDFVRDLICLLSQLATAARRARNSPCLVSADGKIRRGRGKAHLPEVVPAKYVCAAIVAEVWAFSHAGEDPTPSNRSAWAAADGYWNTWPRSENSWGNDPLTKWKRYFEGIGDTRLHTVRKEVRRHLAIRAMHHNLGI
jgi:hypothetical protein